MEKPEAYIHLKVLPRSSKNGILEIMPDGTARVKLTAPPVDGKANECLVEYLSTLLGLRKTAVEIKSGHTARNKEILIKGRTQESVDSVLAAAVKK